MFLQKHTQLGFAIKILVVHPMKFNHRNARIHHRKHTS